MDHRLRIRHDQRVAPTFARGAAQATEMPASRAATAGGEVTVHVRARWDDCDRYGHVNNAAYIALIRAAQHRAGLPDGQLRSLDLTYRRPIAPEADVAVEVAILEQGPAQRTVAYRLRVNDGPAADATAVWQLVGARPRPILPPIGRDAGGRPFRFRQAVRSYEVGPDGAVRPQAVLEWLEHAVFRAAVRAEWPRERMESAGFVTYVVRHKLGLGEVAREGDDLVVTSRLIDLRRVSGIWHHEIHAPDGGLVAIDRARGAFLDLEGRTKPAPPELLDDLLRGEPPR